MFVNPQLFLILLLLFLLPLKALAVSRSVVVFNEIAWMGTTASANKEWAELYNNSDATIDLGGWRIIAEDGIPSIILAGKIIPNGFYLLERTNDETVPEIKAEQIYTGALENNGENLRLLDQENNLIDEISSDDGWPGGDNSVKQTMERKGMSWSTSRDAGGTPGRKNSLLSEPIPSPVESLALSSPIVSGDISGVPPAITSPALSYPKGIILSEILPSPLGPDEVEEWLEIFNQNDFPVDLSGWQLTDFFGKTKEYSFPAGTMIGERGYFVIKRPTSQIILNNQEEKISLLTPTAQAVDAVSYQNALRGQSLSRFDSRWSWTKTLTPGNVNILVADQAKDVETSPLSAQAGLVLPEKIREIGNIDHSPLRTFGLALLIAALSGTAILMLKVIMTKSKA
ncbi:MAG: lamin tail domain-containing protein [bacterium]|nr:lamin tail domain-containing protein [bacterium]